MPMLKRSLMAEIMVQAPGLCMGGGAVPVQLLMVACAHSFCWGKLLFLNCSPWLGTQATNFFSFSIAYFISLALLGLKK
jgi:hypothetical protein